MQCPYILIIQAVHVRYNYGVERFVLCLFNGGTAQPYRHHAVQYSTRGADCHHCSLLTTAFCVKAPSRKLSLGSMLPSACDARLCGCRELRARACRHHRSSKSYSNASFRNAMSAGPAPFRSHIPPTRSMRDLSRSVMPAGMPHPTWDLRLMPAHQEPTLLVETQEAGMHTECANRVCTQKIPLMPHSPEARVLVRKGDACMHADTTHAKCG